MVPMWFLCGFYWVSIWSLCGFYAMFMWFLYVWPALFVIWLLMVVLHGCPAFGGIWGGEALRPLRANCLGKLVAEWHPLGGASGSGVTI